MHGYGYVHNLDHSEPRQQASLCKPRAYAPQLCYMRSHRNDDICIGKRCVHAQLADAIQDITGKGTLGEASFSAHAMPTGDDKPNFVLRHACLMYERVAADMGLISPRLPRITHVAWSMVWFRWGCTASCGWHVRCVGVRGDAWSVLLSPCNTRGMEEYRVYPN